MYLEIENEGFGNSMAILDMATAMVEVFACCDVKMVPILFNHLVRSEFVVMPSREDELGTGTAKSLKQIMLVL